MRETELVTGEIYHVCSRSTEGIPIFLREEDCDYFLTGLYYTNTTAKFPDGWRRLLKQDLQTPGVCNYKPPEGETLVRFFALTLMPNHFHFLLQQLVNNGIARFLQRNLNSYSKYTNTKYERRGSLFMGPYRAVRIARDAQAGHIMTYIHANVLDMIESGWRNGMVADWQKAEQFLCEYKWSSLGVFLEKGPTHHIIKKLVDKEFASSYYTSPQDHMEAIRQWGMRERNFLADFTIE